MPIENLAQAGYLARYESVVFQKKMQRARSVIVEAMKTASPLYVSSSFGKDSVVVLHIALQVDPHIKVLFVNSNYCFPDTYDVRDSFVRDHGIDLHEISQPHDYMDVIRKYGLPEDRSPAQQKKVVSMLKKDLANEWAVRSGYRGCVWGIRAEESSGRRLFLKNKGQIYQSSSGLYRISPLVDWKYEDIWAYIHVNNVPYSGIYDKIIPGMDRKQIRNTSWITTDGAKQNGRVAWLKKFYPEHYAKLLQLAPEVSQYA